MWRERVGRRIVVARDDGFWIVDATGALRRHRPTQWAFDDEMGKSTLAIEGDALVERREVTRGFTATEHDVKVLAADLVPATDDVAAAALVARAVEREDARAAAVRAAADARVAVLDQRGPSFGPEVQRAEALLVARLRIEPDDVYPMLHRALVAVAEARPHPTALAAVVHGCLLACFAVRGLHAPVTEGVRPPLDATLEECACALDQSARWQEDVDANLNAAQLRRAAAAIRAAKGSR